MGRTLLIDNYDSFTWNIYADIAVLGGDPLVRRNDKITLDEIAAMHASGDVDRIVISPGPGHPRTDSGISRQVITWATGRLPVLGVCMGLECLVDVMGGEIAYAGEIKHGKTSDVEHDGLGIFHGLQPLLSSTRYHSLSASLLTLPPALQVSATTAESGVIMGVRHRTATVEAVQYHPESCMSEGGRGLMANFLRLQGGAWGGENAWCGVLPAGDEDAADAALADARANSDEGTTAPLSPDPASVAGSRRPSVPSILDKIRLQRLQDVANASATPATTPANLASALALHAAPPLLGLVARIQSTPHTAVMAEIKRASPSKGDIAPHASAPAQALRYALAGASVISVLTEPTWFKGGLSDMLAVRLALDSLPNRPCVLRKDFVLAPYQIDEARLHGADTVLLIVAMLDRVVLQELYDYSVALGMEPLVEVNNPAELEVALAIGAKVIGVNNRNLHDFNVDMGTTSRVNEALRGRDVILCALSGIASPADVERYVAEGVRAVLVGESLMRAPDAGAFLRTLIGLAPPAPAPAAAPRPLVKICGVRSVVDAAIAVDAGADLVGIILVPGTKRCVPLAVAQDIAHHIRSARDKRAAAPAGSRTPVPSPAPWFATHAARLRNRRAPLLVGVFRDQPLEDIIDAVDAIGLDLVQLHGDEPQAWARHIPVPVIKVFRPTAGAGTAAAPAPVMAGGQSDRPGLNAFVLLDAPAGGSGATFDWAAARALVEAGEAGARASPADGAGAATANGNGEPAGQAWPLPIFLAGGLDPANVARAVAEAGGAHGVLVVDVSSGVEDAAGTGKDRAKVEAFVRAAKA